MGVEGLADGRGRNFLAGDHLHEFIGEDEIDLAGGKLSRQLKVANERGCRVVIVQGPDEKAAGEVTIKDMGSGSQQRVPEANAPRVIKELSGSLSQI